MDSGEKQIDLKIASIGRECLIDGCANVMNHPLLDTKHIATAYPALDISSALQTNDELRLNFYRDIFARCDMISHITVESVDTLEWMLVTPTVKAVKLIECNETRVTLSYVHNGQVCVRPEKFSSSHARARLESFQTSSSSIHIPTTRFQCRHWSRGSPFSSSEIYHLTHIHINNSFPSELSEALKKGGLQCLTHLKLGECIGIERNIHRLFQSLLPKLKQFNLFETELRAGDLRALCLACNGEKKTLPKLTSLCLSLPHIRANALSKNLFALPWPHLKEFYLYLNEPYCTDWVECLYLALKENKLPHLSGFGIEDGKADLPISVLNAMNKLEYLLFYNCDLPDKVDDTLINLPRLEILKCMNVNRFLSELFSQGALSLSTLVLNGCSLETEDLIDLAQASTEGSLPELKHLHLSDCNLESSTLIGLFYNSCTWNELLTLDIRNNRYLHSDFRTDFMTMVQTNGLLGSLQELGIDRYPPVDTVWSCLKSLYLSSCETHELRHILDAARECFPSLRSICVERFESYDAVLVHDFQERNISCHEAIAPWHDPFTRVRCYCQK